MAQKVKNPLANSRDEVLIPVSGRSLGEGNGNSFQYSCLGNPMDRGAWQATAHGITKELDKTERVHFHFSLSCIGEGNGNPLQYSCLGNPIDREAWQAVVHGVAKESDTT